MPTVLPDVNDRGEVTLGSPVSCALAINVMIPEKLRWTDTRRGEEFTLTTLNVRLLPDGRLAVKAYGRPTGGGRGTYVSFPCRAGPSSSPWLAKLQAAPARFGLPTVVSAKVRLLWHPGSPRLAGARVTADEARVMPECASAPAAGPDVRRMARV